MRRRSAALACFAALAACHDATSARDTPDAAASPQASAVPAPLANAPTTAGSAAPTAALADAGPPLVSMRGDAPLAADGAVREAVGYALSAVLHVGDVAGPLRAPELNGAGLDAARKKTDLRLAIDLTPSRMRVALLGAGYVLPPDTEIRARSDRAGHVVVWPGGGSYRPLPPGALRALLSERRFDVAPLGPADVDVTDETGKRIGVRTRKVEVTTRAAKATFEVGRLAELGDGGALLCRMLLDLMSTPPQSAVCGGDELPMRAELHWTAHGSLVFDVTGVLKKTDVPTSALLVPPATATYAAAALPVAGVARILEPHELSAFRVETFGTPPPTPGEGLLVANTSELLRVLYVDGIPVAWAAPGARDLLPLPRGRYVVQWRTFLGDAFDPPLTQPVPAVTPDAGVK
jgi:hypothetical protein